MPIHTIDLNSAEVLMVSVLLGQFVADQNKRLKKATDAAQVERMRRRIEIASQVHGKMPRVSFEDAEDAL